MPKKITYIISRVDKALEFEWVIQYLDTEKYTLSFVLLNPEKNLHLAKLVSTKGLELKEVQYRGQKDFISALWQVFRFLVRHKPELVNCHLPEGTLIGLLAAKLAGIKKRIYTRHHSTLNHDFHPHAIKYDKWSNQLATHIIAVSDTVKKVLVDMEGVPSSKITVIHHGLDLDQFRNVSIERTEAIRAKYVIPKTHPIIGVIARYTKWKGIQYIIPAFKQLLETYPDAHLVLANARKGDFIEEIDGLLNELPRESYTEIAFEPDLYALYPLFDLFVHTPIDERSEAFGQIYIEALMAGIPSVFTLSGIANELIQDGRNGLVVPYQDSKSIFEGLLKLLEDEQLCELFRKNGKIDVMAKFTIARKIDALEELYSK